MSNIIEDELASSSVIQHVDRLDFDYVPEELPHRLMQLYTFKNDNVLDPFAGSGNACLAAIKDQRNYVGYDIDYEYVKLAEKRISSYRSQLNY